MSLLPRTVPTVALTALTATFAVAGLALGALKPGTRVTHTTAHQGATWELTYLGPMDCEALWRLTGPGVEQGLAVTADEAAELITAPVCTTCGDPATRRITHDLYRGLRRTAEPFCAFHGDWLLTEKHRRPVEAPIPS